MGFMMSTHTNSSKNIYNGGSGWSAVITPAVWNYPSYSRVQVQVTIEGLNSAGGTLTVGFQITRSSTTFQRPKEEIEYAAGDTNIVFELAPISLLQNDDITLQITSDNSSDTSVDIVSRMTRTQEADVQSVANDDDSAANMLTVFRDSNFTTNYDTTNDKWNVQAVDDQGNSIASSSELSSTESNLTSYVQSCAQQSDLPDYFNTLTIGSNSVQAITDDGNSIAKASDLATVLSRLGSWASDSILGAFQALFRSDAAAPTVIGGTFDPADDSLEAHSAVLAAIPTTGTGSVQWGMNFKVAGVGIDGVEVRIYAEQACTTIVAGPKYTDANGDVTFDLDPDTYYCRAQHAGYDFNNPTEFTVS